MVKKRSYSKIVLGLISVFALVLVVGVCVFFVRGITQDVNWLSIENVNVSEEAIVIKAFSPNSGDMVSGYDYSTKDKTVYVKLRGTLVNVLGNSIDTDNIVINGDFSGVNKIVLRGKFNESKVIWNK